MKSVSRICIKKFSVKIFRSCRSVLIRYCATPRTETINRWKSWKGKRLTMVVNRQQDVKSYIDRIGYCYFHALAIIMVNTDRYNYICCVTLCCYVHVRHTHTHCEIPLITLRVVTERVVFFFMFMLRQRNSEIDRWRRRPLSRRVNFLSWSIFISVRLCRNLLNSLERVFTSSLFVTNGYVVIWKWD